MAITQETLRMYVADMAAAEREIREAVSTQLDDDRIKGNYDYATLLGKIFSILDKHVQELDRFHPVEGPESLTDSFKKGVSTVMGMAAGIYGMVRGPHPISKMFRDNYTALSMAAISYTMLHTTALAFQNQDVADLALDHLRDITPLIVELSEFVPSVVLNELSEQSAVVDLSIIPQAVNNTHQAWSREVVSGA